MSSQPSKNASKCLPSLVMSITMEQMSTGRYLYGYAHICICFACYLLAMHAVLSLFAMLIKHMLCWTVMSSFYRYYMVAAVLWPLQCLIQNQYNDDCPPDQNKTKFFRGRANFYSPLDLKAQMDLTRQNVGFGGADVLNAIGLKTKPEYEVCTTLHRCPPQFNCATSPL